MVAVIAPQGLPPAPKGWYLSTHQGERQGAGGIHNRITPRFSFALAFFILFWEFLETTTEIKAFLDA